MSKETIQNNKLVALNITIRDQAGELLETTEGVLPMLYIHGHNHIPAGFEHALQGKSLGDRVEAVVEPEHGYGFRDEELLQTVPRTALDGEAELEIGMQISAETEDGPVAVRIVAMDADTITVDGNHVYAGLQLHFSAEVRNVRNATEEELTEGPYH